MEFHKRHSSPHFASETSLKIRLVSANPPANIKPGLLKNMVQNSQRLFFLKVTILLFLQISLIADEPTKEQIEFFEKKIRPILTEHCFECHAAEKQESDLRLDSRDSILRGGASGPAASVDDPGSSLLIKVLKYDGDVEMPPDQKLDNAIVENIRKWIEMDLPWPKKKSDKSVDSTPLTMDQKLTHHRDQHWAFQSLVPYQHPATQVDDWSRNRLDKLIRKKLDQQKITPSPDASRFQLTRRLYLLLLGVPPTFKQAQRAANDPSPHWYENLVDQLLGDPRYGERWGRHWLDVARYADTRGYSFQKDRNYPHAYTYRDYVISSWNDDKPFDRFVQEQLAADYLPLNEDLRPLAALGFLTVGRKFNNVHDDIDDKIDVVFRGLQGLTVSCARCHDHKYDAIPTEDYYSLYGVFASAREGDLPYIGLRPEIERFQKKKSAYNEAQNRLQQHLAQQRNQIVDQARSNTAIYLANVLGAEEKMAIEKFKGESQSDFRFIPKIARSWRDYLRGQASDNHPVWSPWKSFAEIPPSDDFESRTKPLISEWEKSQKKINPLLWKELTSHPPKNRMELAGIYGKIISEVYSAWKKAGSNDQGLAKLSAAQQQIGIALFTDRTPTEIKTENIKAYLDDGARSTYEQLKQAVAAQKATLPAELDRAMVVSDNSTPVEPVVFIRGQAGRRGKKVPRQFIQVLSPAKQDPFTHGAGRLDIAEKITDPRNPLTARVLVNRIWMRLMGSSLVSTPSDFGTRCPEPVQRDVLDLMAAELIRNDWSIKSIQRMILTSSTFRQASDYRADASAIDTNNSLYWKNNRQRLEFEPLRDSMLFVSKELDNAMGGKSVEITKPPYAKRRAVYGYIDRQDLPNLFRAFDFASPDQSSAKRSKTTVPQQMLFLMNSPFVIERAQKIADQVLATEDPNKIGLLYQLIFARNPTAAEREVARAYVKRETNNKVRWRNLAQILIQTNEFSFVD